MQGKWNKSETDFQGQKTDEDVAREIERLDDVRKYTADQIRIMVAALPEYEGRVPKLRAVQGIIRKYRDRQGKEIWSFIDSDPEDARLVLPVLAHLSHESDGRRRLTRTEAEWIARVGKTVPWFDAEWRWIYASLYMARIQSERDTHDLDQDLGVALVENKGDQLRKGLWQWKNRSEVDNGETQA